MRRSTGVAAVLALALCGCWAEPGPSMTPAQVIEKHAPELMAVPGVVGVAESADSTGRPVVVIMLRERTRELERRLPRRIEGYPVKLEVTGTIRPLGE